MIRIRAIWNRVRSTLEKAGAWSLILGPALNWLGKASAIDWLITMIPTGLAQWLAEWGWALVMPLGFLWLYRMNQRRRDFSPEENAFRDLPYSILNALRKFDRLCRLYEQGGGEASLLGARLELDFAVERVLKLGIKTLPPDDRHRYEGVARKVILEAMVALEDDELSRLGQELKLTNAIRHFLGMKRRSNSPADTSTPKSGS